MMRISSAVVIGSRQAGFTTESGQFNASNIDYAKSAAWRLEAVMPQVCIGGDVWPE